jgi:hypothetical protein
MVSSTREALSTPRTQTTQVHCHHSRRLRFPSSHCGPATVYLRRLLRCASSRSSCSAVRARVVLCGSARRLVARVSVLGTLELSPPLPTTLHRLTRTSRGSCASNAESKLYRSVRVAVVGVYRYDRAFIAGSHAWTKSAARRRELPGSTQLHKTTGLVIQGRARIFAGFAYAITAKRGVGQRVPPSEVLQARTKEMMAQIMHRKIALSAACMWSVVCPVPCRGVSAAVSSRIFNDVRDVSSDWRGVGREQTPIALTCFRLSTPRFHPAVSQTTAACLAWFEDACHRPASIDTHARACRLMHHIPL